LAIVLCGKRNKNIYIRRRVLTFVMIHKKENAACSKTYYAGQKSEKKTRKREGEISIKD